MRLRFRSRAGAAAVFILASTLVYTGVSGSAVAADETASTPTPTPAASPTSTPSPSAPTSTAAPLTSNSAPVAGTPDPTLAEMNATHNHTMGSTIPNNTASSASPNELKESAVTFPPGVPGLDVSGWQTNVNWSSVYASGGRFAYIKATESTDYTSSQFSSQYTGSYNAGLIRGAYHFATPNTSSGITQAQFFVANGGGWTGDGRTLPPLLDIEYNPYGATCYGLSQAAMVQWIYQFSSTVLALTGRNPAIYSTTNWWSQCTGNSAGFAGNPLFIARYPNSISEGAGTLPASWSNWTMWQFDDATNGLFPGDQDVFNGTTSDLQSFAFGSDRVAGADEYGTSAALSATFSPGVSTAYIASGAGYADALSAAAAAGRDRGPVLLVAPTTIPSVIGTELTRLKPQKIVIVGGTSAISSTVQSQLASYTSGGVSRLAGDNRYGTSAAVAGTFAAKPATLFVATGENFPDALSGAALAAGGSGGPLVLVQGDSIPDEIATQLTRLKPGRIVIMGGTSAVSDDVATQLQAFTTGVVSRIAGADRYATAAIESSTFHFGVGTAYVAVGTNYPDALSGAPVAGSTSSPVLLVPTDSVPGEVAAELTRLKPGKVVILGGPAAVSTAVANALQSYATNP